MAGRPRPTRRFSRMLRVNEVVRETLGDELERLSDPRLDLVTVTGVEVAPDLRHATVFYSRREQADAAATAAALRAASPHLRTALGRQVRLKYLPELAFREDPAIAAGARVEEILREQRRAGDPPFGDA